MVSAMACADHSINLPWLRRQIGTTDLSDPVQNIRAGAYILGGYLKRYSLTDSLMAYNLGEGGAKGTVDAGHPRDGLHP